MTRIKVYVRPDGAVEFLQSAELEASQAVPCGFMGGRGSVRRLSDIEPDTRWLRVLFQLARWLGGDRGRIAAWTRGWYCRWRVDLRRVGGPVMRENPATGRAFVDRREAVATEVRWLERNYLPR